MSTLYVAATPIGNLKDVSSRVLEVLKNCDYIIAEDTRHTLKLLSHYDIHKKLISYHKHNENSKAKEIISDMKNNNLNVVLVTDAGTPCISDPRVCDSGEVKSCWYRGAGDTSDHLL